MRTNLKDLGDQYRNLMNTDLYNDLDIKVSINNRKAAEENGNCGSITFNMKQAEWKLPLNCTIYITENNTKKGRTIESVMFVNNETKALIFNRHGESAIQTAQNYVMKYIERFVSRMKGLEIKPIDNKTEETPKEAPVETTQKVEAAPVETTPEVNEDCSECRIEYPNTESTE